MASRAHVYAVLELRRRMKRIGPYQTQGALPGGGNADVYLAVRDDSSEQVVVKVLRSGPRSEPWRRFVKEVEVVQGLGEFPGVLPILDAGVPVQPESGDRAWYAMPLANRADEVLASSPLEEVVAAVASYADTLARLHALGHHHRDIKPANLYRLGGEWLIGDFGLVDVPDAEAITQPNRRFGPANFLPYELVISPDTADGGPVDVYELAKTIWVLAAPGINFAPLGPQAADGSEYTLERLTEGHPLAPELDKLIEACTRTDPSLRPAMIQVAADLRAWLAMFERRRSGDDPGPLRDAAASVRAAFADDLTAGRLQEQRITIARRRWTSVTYGMEQLQNELADLLPGAVSRANHNATALARLQPPRFDQLPEPVLTDLDVIVIRPRSSGLHPELLLAVLGEFQTDGALLLRAGVFIDFPRIDAGENEQVFESIALVESAQTSEAVEGAVEALRRAAPVWLEKLKDASA